jgi:hypothetical protein
MSYSRTSFNNTQTARKTSHGENSMSEAKITLTHSMDFVELQAFVEQLVKEGNSDGAFPPDAMLIPLDGRYLVWILDKEEGGTN